MTKKRILNIFVTCMLYIYYNFVVSHILLGNKAVKNVFLKLYLIIFFNYIILYFIDLESLKKFKMFIGF